MEEVWEEGEEFIRLREKLNEISVKITDIDKTKKKINTHIRKTKNEKEDKITEEIENELNDQKDLIDFKKTILLKEDQEVKESIEKLEKETVLYQIECKRLTEEQNSKYCSIKSQDRWAVLENRYLILELLGKGGYSEVYKVSLVC